MPTMPRFYQDHQDYIHQRIREILSEGPAGPAVRQRIEDQKSELNADTARLSELLSRLPENQREAVLHAMVQESGVLIFQFILECAELLNADAREAAAQSSDPDSIEQAIRSFQSLVRG